MYDLVYHIYFKLFCYCYYYLNIIIYINLNEFNNVVNSYKIIKVLLYDMLTFKYIDCF